MSEPLSHRSKRLYRDAQEALQAGKLEQAQQAGERLLRQQPAFADGWFQLSLIYQQQGRQQDALVLIERAIKLTPDQGRYLAQKSRLLLNLGRFPEALSEADRTVDLVPSEAWTLDTLGVVYAMLDEHHKALPLFQRASRKQPTNAQYLFNCASALQICGQLDEAETTYRQAIDVKPDFCRARWSLGGLRKATANNNDIDVLQSLLQNESLNSMDRCYLGYSLGKQYEDLGDYSKAFDCFHQAGQWRRQTLPYRRDSIELLIDTLIETYNATDESPGSGYDSEEPIFIVGMPRTGTTLVERILSAHSDVFAAGELRNFGVVVDHHTGGGMDVLLSAPQVEKSTALDYPQLGKDYIDSTRPRTARSPHFIDKLPLNFLYLGLIARALPKARFIHVVRNPMDTCWSNFKQLFAAVYPYSYDLDDTAHFYLQYRRLMEHWNRTLPARIFNIQYETLVEHQEAETRRLLDYCGLPWQSGCMDFHRSTDAVATASSVQVRRPIYRSSIGRWQQYREQLQSAEQILRNAGIDPEARMAD